MQAGQFYYGGEGVLKGSGAMAYSVLDRRLELCEVLSVFRNVEYGIVAKTIIPFLFLGDETAKLASECSAEPSRECDGDDTRKVCAAIAIPDIVHDVQYVYAAVAERHGRVEVSG